VDSETDTVTLEASPVAGVLAALGPDGMPRVPSLLPPDLALESDALPLAEAQRLFRARLARYRETARPGRSANLLDPASPGDRRLTQRGW
jgi:hypothetical protein